MRLMDPKTRRTVIQIARYALLLFFVVIGVYFWLVMLRSASFSVPAEPLMSEIYKTRAIVGLPIALLLCSVGVLFFICLRPGTK
jgi:TRAP-type C4-dicarboxylate transport system permease small subunit